MTDADRLLVAGDVAETQYRWFPVHTMVYGHLHIPRTTWHEGMRFEEVPVGCPREWRKRSGAPGRLRRILPGEGGEG